jgi:hypothetical protein
LASAGLAVDQCHQVDAEYRLQVRVLIEVVEHHVGGFAPPQLDHQPHAFLVGLIAKPADSLDALFLDELGDLFDQTGLVHLIGKLGDDDALSRTVVGALEVDPGAHVNAATAGVIGLANSAIAVNLPGGGEVRPRKAFHQSVDVDVRIF